METINIVSREQARKLNALIGESFRTTTANVSETLDGLDNLLCGFGETINAEGLGLDLVRQCRGRANVRGFGGGLIQANERATGVEAAQTATPTFKQ